MQGIADASIRIRRISPNDGLHYFYGYYDNQAFSADGKKHLCCRTDFFDRIPGRDDICTLGVFDIATGDWHEFAQTGAFNFQQGSMLQWNPLFPESEVIYNIREGDEYRAVVRNLAADTVRTLPRPVINISPDGRWGLSANMSRIYDFRPGYGYSGTRDSCFDIPQPENDGLFLLDMETGNEKLILNYKNMAPLLGADP